MTNKDLADLIFPNLEHDIDYYESLYPERELKEGEKVTRFAPSPTGYMHIGGFYQALTDYVLAKNSGGIFYIRNEATDKLRQVDSAVELIMSTLREYGIVPDEYEYKGEIVGNYGPYIQSERKDIQEEQFHDFVIKKYYIYLEIFLKIRIFELDIMEDMLDVEILVKIPLLKELRMVNLML